MVKTNLFSLTSQLILGVLLDVGVSIILCYYTILMVALHIGNKHLSVFIHIDFCTVLVFD
jgi:hypothetical protein